MRTSLWTAVGARALADIEASRWRRWPDGVPLQATADRTAVVARARALARDEGAGHVLELQLQPERFARIADRPLQAGELGSVLTAAIMENADYQRGVDEVEIARAERTMGLRFPVAWRASLMRETWFRRGWLASGAFVWLLVPEESAGGWNVWASLGLDDRPGVIPIGNDGGGEHIVVDARDPESPVHLMPNVSQGWADAIVQAASVEAFVDAVEAGTFRFVFDD